jgi:hypothetical protein
MVNKDRLSKDLDSIWKECKNRNWDGYHASPLSLESFWRTKALIKLLSEEDCDLELCADPYGMVSVEWYYPNIMFLITVENKTLECLQICLSEKNSFSVVFDGKKLPIEISNGILTWQKNVQQHNQDKVV